MTREEVINEIEKIDSNIMLVVDQKTDIELEEIYQALKYPQRRKDGQRFSDMQGAKLILLNAPDVVKKAISDFFAPSQNFLVLGWWKSALRDLKTRESNAYVSTELLGGIITYIETYISNSYK